MKYGTFLGFDWRQKKVFGPNTKAMLMEEFMEEHGLTSPRPGDVLGDFETILLDSGVERPTTDEGWEKLHRMAIQKAERIKELQLTAFSQLAAHFRKAI